MKNKLKNKKYRLMKIAKEDGIQNKISSIRQQSQFKQPITARGRTAKKKTEISTLNIEN